jgi:glycosyltransferase 2 family protein
MPGARSQRIAVTVIGLLGSAVFIALALHHLDFRSVLATWRGAHVFPWIPLAVVSYVAGHFVRGQRLRVLVKRETVLTLATATNIVVVGYASNNVFPARLGEFVRAGMLAERTGMPLSQSLTITFIERLFDGIAILILLLAGTLSLSTRPPWIWDVARVGSVIFGSALAGLLVAVFLPSMVLSTASRMSAHLASKWRDRALALASSVTSAGAVLRRPREATFIGVYSVIVWVLESLMFAFILPVFSLRLALAPALIAMSVTNLGILVPSSPGFVGSFHFFCSQALASQGVPAATAMGYALLVHLTFYVPVTLWGAGAILWYGVQVGTTAALARAARSSPLTETVGCVTVHVIARLEPMRPPRDASEFDIALTEALLTPHGSALDHSALSEVATFLSQEMEALPARLRVMFETGMATFRFYVRLRYFRSFCALDVDRRRSVVESWAFGRVGLFRQLFRPARSIALLAYYERAAVARALSPLPLAGLSLVSQTND